MIDTRQLRALVDDMQSARSFVEQLSEESEFTLKNIDDIDDFRHECMSLESELKALLDCIVGRETATPHE